MERRKKHIVDRRMNRWQEFGSTVEEKWRGKRNECKITVGALVGKRSKGNFQINLLKEID